MKVLALGVFLLVLSSAVLAPVRAEETEQENERENEFMERELEIDINTNEGAKFKSHGKDDSEMKIEISNDGGGLRLRVQLEAENGDEEWHSEHELNLYELVEYTNDDGAPGFDPKGSDSVVSSTDLNSLSYTFSCAQVGTDYYRCDARSSSGVFNMTFHVVGSVHARPGEPDLLPNGVEFDVHVRKTTSNPLAIIARFEGKVEQESESADETEAEKADDVNEQEESIKAGGAQFAWLKTATLNGQNVPITKVLLDEKDLTFSFDTTDTGDIVWDPFIGVLFSAAPSFVPAATMLFAAISALLFL